MTLSRKVLCFLFVVIMLLVFGLGAWAASPELVRAEQQRRYALSEVIFEFQQTLDASVLGDLFTPGTFAGHLYDIIDVDIDMSFMYEAGEWEELHAMQIEQNAALVALITDFGGTVPAALATPAATTPTTTTEPETPPLTTEPLTELDTTTEPTPETTLPPESELEPEPELEPERRNNTGMIALGVVITVTVGGAAAGVIIWKAKKKP